MPYSVELRFDAALTRRIVEILGELPGLGSGPLPAEAAPHVSLSVYDECGVEPARLSDMTDRLAAEGAPLPVSFSSIGQFPTEERVLFLAPVVSRPLLDLHAAWHALAADFAGSCWPCYLPGGWVPHCTLGTGVPAPELAAAIERLRERWTPLAGTLQSLALIRAQPVEVLHQRPLSG